MAFRWRRDSFGPIAIDLGASSVKMLQLADRSGRLAVIAHSELDVPRNIESADEYEAWAKSAVTESLRHSDFRGRRVVSALGTSEFQLKNIRLPQMPAEDLVSAVEFEAAERFQLSPTQAHFRHLPAGTVRQGNEMREEVVVFAATDEMVRRRANFLTSLRLDAEAIDLAPCAMARSFIRFLRRAEDASSVNIFLDVGHRATGLVITRGADVCFVKVIEIGGRTLTQAVSERLDMTPAKAEELRRKIMQRAAWKDPQACDELPQALLESMTDAVRSSAEHMAREVQLSLRYFTVTFRGQRPESLTFVGGEAYDPALISMVGSGHDIPCTIGNPFRGIAGGENVLGTQRRGYQPAWAVATGLALRGAPWRGGESARRAARPRAASEASA